MSLLSPSQNRLLHPSQVLTVQQAEYLVQCLIDHFTETVRDLPRTALDLDAFHDWETRLEALVQHASVLEQILCRICFFLSGEDVQNVVAIVVLTHYQLSILECANDVTGDCIILTSQRLSDMSDYLNDVYKRLIATHDWVQSDDYASLRRSLEDAIAEMRDSHFSFVTSPNRNDTPFSATSSHSIDTLFSPCNTIDGHTHELSSRLGPLLGPLSPSRATSISDTDCRLLYRNFTPLLMSNAMPYRRPEHYTCAELEQTDTTDSSSDTAYSDSSRPSPKGKRRMTLDDSSEDSLPRRSSWSTSPAPSTPPPTRLWTSQPFPSSSSTSRKRSWTDSTNGQTRKKQRVSVQLYGVDGCLSDCATHDAVIERVQPFVGHAVPFDGSLTLSSLPSFEADPHSLQPITSTDEEGTDAEDDSDSDTASYVTAETGTDLADVSVVVNPAESVSDVPMRDPSPGNSSSRSRRRQCFAGLLQAARHLFGMR